MVNKVILVGYLGQAPELNHTSSGQAITNMRIATSRNWKDKSTGERKTETEWHDITVWGRQAETCASHLAKGRLVYIEGRIRTEKWQDKQSGQDRYRTKIVAESVRFLGGAPSPEGQDDPETDQEPS